MRPVGLGFKLGMELTGYKPGMFLQLDDLNEVILDVDPGKSHTLFFK